MAVAITTLGLIALLLVSMALAEAMCLSKSEARQLWPTRHIYWYRDDGRRCWSNRHGPPRNLRIDPIMGNLHAEATSTKKADRLKYVGPDEYNELDAQADKDAYFQAEPLPLWPPILPLPLQQPPRFIPWEDRIK